ncbi:MAG: phenylalanine 4-monooxygenase, partial [Gemmatimonadaceae bacterium]
MSTHPHEHSSEAPATSVVQNWSAYSKADHEVWQILYAKRMRELESTASDVFLNGAELIGLSENSIPDLAEVNYRLDARTGWNAVPVGGFLPAKEFFASLAQRRFPTTVSIRSRENIDYVPEPDIFHDVFGHVPL